MGFEVYRGPLTADSINCMVKLAFCVRYERHACMSVHAIEPFADMVNKTLLIRGFQGGCRLTRPWSLQCNECEKSMRSRSPCRQTLESIQVYAAQLNVHVTVTWPFQKGTFGTFQRLQLRSNDAAQGFPLLLWVLLRLLGYRGDGCTCH
jgi:hypothetical protein